MRGIEKNMQNIPTKLKDLAHKYDINIESIYYKTSKKKYSFNKIKKEIFEKKYGSGNHNENYFNYYLPRILKSKKITELKKEFFTDWKLSSYLTYCGVEKLWEEIMTIYLNL